MLSKKKIKILKALANEKRMEILDLLENNNDLCVFDIAKKIHLHFKSTSKHLQKLVEAGLIERSRDGLYVKHELREAVKRLLRDADKLES